MAEALIRQRVEDYAKAISAKDIERVMSFFAPDVVSFDLAPPLRYSGSDSNVDVGKEASLRTAG